LNTIGCICFAEICKLGQYWYQTGKECKDCVKGSYQDDLLMYECKVCSVNTTTREVAAVSPSNCTCEFISINLADNPDNTLFYVNTRSLTLSVDEHFFKCRDCKQTV